MPLRTHQKLFLSYSLLVVAVVGALSLGVEVALREPLLQEAIEELQRELALGRALYDEFPDPDSDELARRMEALTGHRVTVIALDGEVLGDSGVEPDEVVALENHLTRPEVREALELGRGTDVRHSASVGRDLLYAAAPTESGPILRFAVGIEAIDGAVARVRRQILQVGAIAILLSAVFSLAFSVAVTRPLRRMRDIAASMADGDLTGRVDLSRDDELGELGTALDRLAGELQRRLVQLEGERAEMTALVDSMTEAVIAIAADGRIRRVNPAARRIFNLDASVGGGAPDTVSRDPTFLKLVRRAAKGDSVPPTELVHGDRHLLATAQALPSGGAVLVLLDTTELRRLEGIRRDFVANASHELKTPLTVIRGQAETLADEDLPPELRREFTERLRANADRLHRILEDLLDLSRIESGGWTVSPEPVDLAELAAEVWGSAIGSAADRRLDFRVDADESVRTIEADPEALRQVFSNLFSNAIRHTEDAGSVQVAINPGPAGTVTVEVRDAGSGIPGVHLDRIFERFYRVDPARSRAEGGTGLGLSIVRHLVERHGGRIEAESRLGHGTTIRFYIPLANSVPSSPPPGSPPPA